MWSEKYNPMVCFDALYSTSKGQRLENLDIFESCSGSRIALPGGGYIDLPGIESPPEQEEEDMFPSNRLHTTGQLGPGQLGSGQLGSGHLGSRQLGSGQLGSRQLGSGQLGPGQLGSGQLGSGQLGSGQLGSGQLGSGQLGSSSGSRVALPGGGYIDLPGVESPPEQDDEHMHPSDMFHNHNGSRIKLPGGGFIDLPGLESPNEQEKQVFPSDIFQDYDLPEESRTIVPQGQVTSLLSTIQSLEIELVQKHQILIQQERENKRLREHLNRFMRIVTDRNFELHNLRSEASGVIRDLRTWGARLDGRNKSLREKVDKKDATIASLLSEACSVPLLRRLLERGKKEREDLREKLHALEKSAQDLMTKNSVLEHELTVIPREMMCLSDPKSFTKAEVHSVHTQATCALSNEPPRPENTDQSCSTAVDEQKVGQMSKDDPEQILVLQSDVVQKPENKTNLLKKAKKVLTLAKWRRHETSKTQSELHADSLKRMN